MALALANDAMPIGVIGASLPPATTADAHPRRMISAASPIACALLAQADVGQ